MNWKKTLIWVILFTLVIGLFEVAFLYDFRGNTGELTETVPKHPVWFLLILHTLILTPCFILGYGRANPLSGFFPPLLLNVLFWYLSALKMKQTTAQLDLTAFPHFYHLIAGTSLLIGFFGIIIVFVTRKLMEMMEEARMEKESANQEKQMEGDKQAEVNIKVGDKPEDVDNTIIQETNDKKTDNSNNENITEKPVIEGNVPVQGIDSSAEKTDDIIEESD